MSSSSPLPKLTLYTYFRSSASARVRTLMELQNIPREEKYIHLLKGDQNSADYASLNASETVPTLIVREADGSEWALGQCLAILEYLDETFGPSSKIGRLLPADAKGRALVRSIMDIIVADVFPFTTMGTLNRLDKLGVDKVQWAKDLNDFNLKALEGLLKKTSKTGEYCYGDSVTLADVCLLAQLYTALRFNPDAIKPFPTISSVFANISKLPAFVKADYKHQPDTPEDLRA